MSKLRVALPLLAAGLSACGGEDGSGPSSGVEDTLDRLGVDTAESPRVDASGQPLPSSYAPLGSTRSVNRVSELMLFGVRLGTRDDEAAGRLTALDLAPTGSALDWAVLSDPEDPMLLTGDEVVRDAATGDFDGDGRDEIAMLAQPAPGEPIEILRMDDGEADYALSDPTVVVTTVEATRITLAAGDLDGDGRDELVAALLVRDPGTREVSARIVVLAERAGRWGPTGRELEIPSSGASSLQVALSVGQMDYDPPEELALGVTRGQADAVRADLLVVDDASAGLAELWAGRADFDTPEGADSAVVVDVDLADVDGDGLDELLFAGLDHAGSQFSTRSNYLVGVRDDAARGFSSLAARKVSAGTGRLQPQASGANHRLSWAHVLGADLDGDGAQEIVVNQLVFDSLAASPGEIRARLHDHDSDAGTDPVPMKIDEEVFFAYRGASRYDYSARHSSMAVGDVTHDGREDVVFWSQRDTQSPPEQALIVYGLDAVAGWGQRQIHPTRFANSGDPLEGRVLLPDLRLGNDTFTLRYSEASHRLVFTEPMIIAALAAAPCSAELGQDVEGSCRTAYGKAVSQTTEVEAGISVTAGVTAGFSASTPVVPSAASAEVTRTVQATARASVARAYTLTKQVLRETGGIEDAVIFTSIPLDIYSYEVLSHPDPSFVGKVVEVRLPREPVTAMVSREFYNATVVPGSATIDAEVFTHIPGDPSSYRGRSDKDRLLRTFNGLEAGPFDVGQGGGQTVVTIDELTETTLGLSYEISVSYDVKTTAGGVVAGFNVGASADAGLRVTRGRQTIYQGSVGNMSAEGFTEGRYAFGLFTYLREGPQQSFEVLDYWVE